MTTKPKKLTKQERAENALRYDRAITEWRDFHVRSCSAPPPHMRCFSAPLSGRFHFKPEEITFRVKSGKMYRPLGVPFIARNGREIVYAVQKRDGRDYGPIRFIDVNNTDLVE